MAVERLSKAYIRASEVASRSIAGECVIVPVRKGVAELDAIFTLDGVGERIWELLEHPVTGERIVEVVCAEYEVTPEQAGADVTELLDDLLAARLIQVAEKG